MKSHRRYLQENIGNRGRYTYNWRQTINRIVALIWAAKNNGNCFLSACQFLKYLQITVTGQRQLIQFWYASMRNNLLLLSAVALSISTAIADENILLENNGFVVFEAETIAARGDWLSTNRISGHTGTGYYLWTGETALNVKKAGRDTLVYNFRITDPGNYELRWRSRIAQGNNRTEHNDSWVRFATGNNVQGEQGLNGWTKAYQNKLNVWSWQTSTVDNVGKPIRQFFAAGDHTIEISGRSNGHAIDRIVLFKYDDHEFDDESFTNAALSAITTGQSH